MRLGVNIDHVATLRQARGTLYPDPVYAALIAQDNGADGITLHLREDRRHIQERDVLLLREQLQVPMNFEMAVNSEMLDFALKIKPKYCCFVPEKRQELTTEGGLDVISQQKLITDACNELHSSDILVSLFIDADKKQIDAAKNCGAKIIELHTGKYAEAENSHQQDKYLNEIISAATYAHSLGLIVNAGHGLHYHNVAAIVAIPVMHELNIGHAIVARSIFVGFAKAVSEMKALLIQNHCSHKI